MSITDYTHHGKEPDAIKGGAKGYLALMLEGKSYSECKKHFSKSYGAKKK